MIVIEDGDEENHVCDISGKICPYLIAIDIPGSGRIEVAPEVADTFEQYVRDIKAQTMDAAPGIPADAPLVQILDRYIAARDEVGAYITLYNQEIALVDEEGSVIGHDETK